MLLTILGALALVLTQASDVPPGDTPADSPADTRASTPANAAAGSDPDALFEMALERMERLSLATTPDPVEIEAIRDLLIHAADQGHGAALNMLGTIASPDGSDGMAPAITYFERAHAAGDPGGSLNFGVALLHTGSAAQEQRGIDLLRTFLERDGLDDNLSGLANGYLGYAAMVGAGGQEADPEQGLALLLLGHHADPANSDFNYWLGRYHESGAGSTVDLAAAARYFIAAGEAGHAVGAWKAGMAYLNGAGVEADALEAFRFVNISARNGYDRGMISLAVMNAIGQGIPVNGERALEWYGRAAALGNAHAMRGLGLMLLVGEAGEADPVTGYALTSLAALAGDAIARQALEQLAGQIPATPDWATAVETARADFLATNNLTLADIYGAEP